MKKDTFWNQLISSIAGLGVPGLVLLLVMASTGFAGAAALTTALSTLGGPLGMMGGIAVLGVLSLMAKGLAAYGLDAIFNAVVDELKRKGSSEDDIVKTVADYPIPGYIKKLLKSKIELRSSEHNSNSYPTTGRRIFTSESQSLLVGEIYNLRALHSAETARVLVSAKLGEGAWKGSVENNGAIEVVQIVYKQGGLREFQSPSRSLAIGSHYKLKERSTDAVKTVSIEVLVTDGFWLGALIEPGGEEEIVNIVYQKR